MAFALTQIDPRQLEDDPGELVEHIIISIQQMEPTEVVKAQFVGALEKLIDSRIEAALKRAIVSSQPIRGGRSSR